MKGGADKEEEEDEEEDDEEFGEDRVAVNGNGVETQSVGAKRGRDDEENILDGSLEQDSKKVKV